jgi:hypothetical protein
MSTSNKNLRSYVAFVSKLSSQASVVAANFVEATHGPKRLVGMQRLSVLKKEVKPAVLF